jgi:hypothetical protein
MVRCLFDGDIFESRKSKAFRFKLWALSSPSYNPQYLIARR